MSHLQVNVVTHCRRVCSLYKKAVRLIQSYYSDRCVFRYEAVLLRSKFEKNRHIKDILEARRLVEEGERQVFKLSHPIPQQFPESPGGIAYEREAVVPDWVLDYWHPMEKAEYPEYFARREQRKKEYLKFWEENYNKPTKVPDYD